MEWQWPLFTSIYSVKCRPWKRGRSGRGRMLSCSDVYLPGSLTMNRCKDLFLPLLSMPEITFKNTKVIHVLPWLKFFRKVTFLGMHNLLWPFNNQLYSFSWGLLTKSIDPRPHPLSRSVLCAYLWYCWTFHVLAQSPDRLTLTCQTMYDDVAVKNMGPETKSHEYEHQSVSF